MTTSPSTDSFQKWGDYLAPFYTLQYPIATPDHTDSFHDSQYYVVGKLDICIVISMIAVMAILRDAFRLGFFEPLARWKLYRDLRKKRARRSGTSSPTKNEKSKGFPNGNGIVSSSPTIKEVRIIDRSVMRFAEQGWSMIYYPLQFAFGLYVHMNLPTKILSPTALWEEYPHVYHAAPLKLYYLSQTAFYTHQVLILNAEARRKDHVQMMTHHIITVVLMVASYFMNFTRVGCIIMVLMDYCDIFLPLAKMIRYLNISQFLTDLTFGWFMISWLITRHVLFLFVVISGFFDAPKLVEFKWDPTTGHYSTAKIFYTFLAMLLALQALQCLWFWLICRIAWRVIQGTGGASDDRSEEEEEKHD
ncbi:TLC domain-containing protein [Crepidotus variabilis]|uniref:TLC domain-containing protein n=1 Tax=Crepidotus variabilis TaxID=179855 RepID=A0A9P6ETC0_9AGAR|nr:TLC domain-containing protein [Crepidotus variabilis]